MAAVCVMGFLLGLDSLRTSAALGAKSLSLRRRTRIALMFGLCDGLAPLLGLALGRAFVADVASWIKLCGVLSLAGYGAFLLFASPRRKTSDESRSETDDQLVLFGLPVVLGLDNLIAGFALGTLGPPVLVSALVLGVISGLMSLLGFCLGGAVRYVFPAAAGRLGGLALILVALAAYLD